MFVLWYCYKRGRETRLEKEKSEAEGALGENTDLPEAQPAEAIPEDRRLDDGPATEPSPVESSAVPK